MSSEGLPGDERLLEWAHRHAYESRLRPRLHALESGVPYGSAALVYACSACSRSGGRRTAARPLRAMAAGVVAWIVSNVLKLAVERPRPCLHSSRADTHSFPEGPGMVLAAVAVAIWPRSRPIALVAVVCALADARRPARLRQPLAERPARRLDPRRAVRSRSSRASPALARAREARPVGNSPLRGGVSWVRCTFLSWSPK